ncbi:MAG: FIST N-terminal domain-containing protein [Candidatus Thermoplasmatota archaeon]|nr:FIST N-terminal domain-containing protein [Candidatus Thermoplasmatota archaeon]
MEKEMNQEAAVKSETQNDDFEASVGMSRKWDAREAGREVAENTLKKLKHKPSFFLLFSTIHYEKNGGFQELLEGVYEILSIDIPLIGGTVTGFMNNYGCYSHGTTALAVSSPNMDIAVGYGKNTKRNPKKAARICSNMILSKLKDSKFNNKFLLNLISSSEMPNIPILGRKKIIKTGRLSSKLFMSMFWISEYFFQKGHGRDDEVIEEVIKNLPDYNILSGGTIDDGAALNNYQFFNNIVLTNSIVSLGMRTNFNLNVKTTHNMKKTDTILNITKTSGDGHIIHKINNQPAVGEFTKTLNWPEDFLTEKNWFRTNYYFPVGFKPNSKDHDFGPRLLGVIIGDSFVTPIRSQESCSSVLTTSGQRILDAIDINLKNYPCKPSFGLISSCATRLETMGSNIYQAKNMIEKYFDNNPFIVFYVGGESTYSPEVGLNYMNFSFNSALFWN